VEIYIINKSVGKLLLGMEVDDQEMEGIEEQQNTHEVKREVEEEADQDFEEERKQEREREK